VQVAYEWSVDNYLRLSILNSEFTALVADLALVRDRHHTKVIFLETFRGAQATWVSTTST
jgi:hypothetical protein